MANIQHGDGVPEGFSVGDDAERAPRTYTWTKEEIDIANCSFYELAEVYSQSKVAPRYPIDQLAIRLCVRHGTTTVPLRSRLLSLDVQPEHVALTWGCSPRSAKTPATLCYVAELVAKNPQTGGFAQRISSKATFVVGPEDAPVRRWEFDDSTQVPPVIRAEVAERAKLDGCDVDGQPWDDGDDEFAQELPPRGRGRHADEFAGQGDVGGYGGAQQPYGAQGYGGAQQPYGAQGYGGAQQPYGAHGYPAPYGAPGRAPYGAPGQAYGGTGPAGAPMRGPNGEDLYTPQGWAFSPARLAEIRAAEEAAAKQKEADARQSAVLAELEAMKRQQEADRRERDAEIARLKADAERREAERREAERREAERREREAEIARLKAENDARTEALRRDMEAAREAQRAQTEAIMQQLRDLAARAAAPPAPPPPPPPGPNIVELVSAAAAAAAPIVSALSASSAATREAETRRVEAAAAEAKAAREAAAEAERRRYEAQQTAENRRYEQQMAAESRRWEEEKAARAHEREMALAASRAQKRLDGADPNAAVMDLTKELRAAIAQAKQSPKGAEGASSLLEKAREFVAIRKLLGLGGDDDDKVEDALADPLVAVEKVAEKLEGPLTVFANILAERLKVQEKPRKGGYVVVAGPLGESLAPALRGRMPNGVEVDISDDHVMLPDGNMVHISMYHASMAQRAAAAHAQHPAPPQHAAPAQPDPLAPAPFPHPGAFDPAPSPPFVQPAPLPPAPFAPAPLPAAQVVASTTDDDVAPVLAVRVAPFRRSPQAPAATAVTDAPPFAEPPGPPIPVPPPFVEPPGPPIPPFVEPLAATGEGPRQLELPSAAGPHPDEPKGG